MKMYKKILTGMVVAVLMLGSVMGVSASESKKATISVSGDSESKYEIVEGADEFSGLKAQDDVMYDKVVEYKEGKITSKELIAGSADAVKALDGKTMITGVYDLALKEGVQAGEKHEVTLLVPALTDKVSDVVVAYYDIQAGAWKTIKPTTVKDQKITVTLNTLGPIAIWASVDTAGDQTSPETGMGSSTWMFWTVAVLVVAGAGAILTQRKRHE